MSHVFAAVAGFALALVVVSIQERLVPAAITGATAAILAGLLARSLAREGM